MRKNMKPHQKKEMTTIRSRTVVAAKEAPSVAAMVPEA